MVRCPRDGSQRRAPGPSSAPRSIIRQQQCGAFVRGEKIGEGAGATGRSRQSSLCRDGRGINRPNGPRIPRRPVSMRATERVARRRRRPGHRDPPGGETGKRGPHGSGNDDRLTRGGQLAGPSATDSAHPWFLFFFYSFLFLFSFLSIKNSNLNVDLAMNFTIGHMLNFISLV